MIVDSKYFSYCKEIGLMKENCSHQAALDCIIKAVKGKRQADPKFVEAVSKLTLSSPEVSVRSCVLYHYDVDLTYVVGGNIKHGRVSDFAQSTGGAPDSLLPSSCQPHECCPRPTAAYKCPALHQ